MCENETLVIIFYLLYDYQKLILEQNQVANTPLKSLRKLGLVSHQNNVCSIPESVIRCKYSVMLKSPSFSVKPNPNW